MARMGEIFPLDTMSLHKLGDGKANNVRPHAGRDELFFSSFDTYITPKEYGNFVRFLEQCKEPVWDVSQRSSLAQISLNHLIRNEKPFSKLKYREEFLRIPAVIALESVYARRNFREVLAEQMEGESMGRLFAYDKAAALDVDEVQELYELPKGFKILSKTEVGLPMDDRHYRIVDDGSVTPAEVLMYANDGRKSLRYVLEECNGPLPSLVANDTLISTVTLRPRVGRMLPTNVVLGIQTTRRDILHLRSPLLDAEISDTAHGPNSDQYRTEIKYDGSDGTLDPQQVKDTLITATFYPTMHRVDLPQSVTALEAAFA